MKAYKYEYQSSKKVYIANLYIFSIKSNVK